MLRDRALFEVATTMEVWVVGDRLAGDFVEGNVLCGQAGCSGNDHSIPDTIGMGDAPLQNLHTTQATTHYRGPLLNTEMVGKPCLALDPVFDCHDREIGSIGFAGFGMWSGRAGGAITATKVVETNDKETIGVDGFARANAGIPPAWFAIIHAVIAGRMVVPGKGMADQDRIVFVGVECPIRLDHKIVLWQDRATLQRQRCREVQSLRSDEADRVVGELAGHRDSVVINWRAEQGPAACLALRLAE